MFIEANIRGVDGLWETKNLLWMLKFGRFSFCFSFPFFANVKGSRDGLR